MEEKEIQIEEGISIANVLHLLWSHVKILIISLLVGCVLGSSFAFWRTYNVKYYGTSIEFYINPEKGDSDATGESQYGVYGAYGRHIMDNMVKLLSSESFIERMMLDGRDLPDAENPLWTAEEESKFNITAKIEAGEEKLALVDVAQEELSKLNAEKKTANAVANKYNADYVKAKDELDELWSEAYAQNMTLFGYSIFNETKYNVLLAEGSLAGEEFIDLINSYNTMKDAKEKWDAERENVNALTEEIDLQTEERGKLQKEANPVVEEALSAWRKTKNYKKTMKLYLASVSFSYLQANEELKDAENLARSFIYVNVSVLNNEEFANALLEDLNIYVPMYIKENMTVPGGYTGTNCLRTTRTDEIVRTNPNYTLKQAIKYGVFAGAIALVLASIVIIILDRSDKRLRDTDIITKYFNVPLLGVVPSIEDLSAEPTKKTDNSSAKEVV